MQAAALAQSITDPTNRAEALASVARALADAGQGGEAIAIAQGIADPDYHARTLVSVITVMAGAHQRDAAMFRGGSRRR